MHHHRSSAPEKNRKRVDSKGPGHKKAEARGSIKKTNGAEASKRDRLNQLRQLRQGKRDELLERRRLGADVESRPAPPKVVALVAFHTQADSLSLKRRILSACGAAPEAVAALPPHFPQAALLPAYAQGPPGTGKPRVLVIDPPRDVHAVMDVVKCADIVVCVLPPHASLEEPAFDAQGYKLLTALKSQGLPVVIGAVHGGNDDAMATSSAKKQAEAKKFITRYFASELGADAKLFNTSTDEEVKAIVRALGSVTPKELTWRKDRGYLLSQEAQYSSADGVLCIRGYVRGPGFRCKHLVHLTGHGDFTLARLEALQDPCPVKVDRSGSCAAAVQFAEQLEPGNEQPDVQRLQPYDPTQEEQTWPTSEELGEMPPPRALPKGKAKRRTGGRIAAPDAEDVPIDDDDDDDMEAEDEAGGGSDAESEMAPSIAPSGTAETEDWDVSSNMTMDIPNAEIIEAEKRRRQEMTERSQEDLEFPDEVDTPLDVPARERFQKYRGLKSFRTSPWDPYEELPVEYSRIYEFEAFGSTARAVKHQYADDCYELGGTSSSMSDNADENAEGGGGTSALYCALYLKDVPPTVFEHQARGVPFIVSGLFPCEQKVSVVHGQVLRLKEYTEIMKSKQEVIAHCGFRRFPVRPTYSEIPKKSSQCKKYKFMRFLHQEVTACMSFYAPVIFPPCRLLVFAKPEGDRGPGELACVGSITGADPKQLIIKRAMLTGYPFKTHKSKAVVRFMFFNPADIRWFKPVELSTKKGLRGHISESLGTHGYMKCRFSGPIKQDDTVCMQLYKRVYPKWHPPSWGGKLEDTPETA